MLKESDISVLNMLISGIEDNFDLLKKAYEEKNAIEFNKLKRFILKIQKEIFEIVK